MKISIIKKPLAGGRQALKLQYYYGYEKTADGKTKHQRKVENLDLFLYEKPKDTLEKNHNKEALRVAEAIQAKRIVEAAAGQHGFSENTKEKASFIEFFKKVMAQKQRETSKSNAALWDCCFKWLQKYHPEQDLSFERLTPEFINGFKDFLLNQAKTKTGNPLSKSAAGTYFGKFRTAVHEAYAKGIIFKNPLLQVATIKPDNTKREYLTITELKALVKTDCRYDVLKRAFLFSCLTGLRWIDIVKLTWADVQDFDGGYRIVFTQQKTKGLQYLDIPPQAYELMGIRSAGKVFTGLRYSGYSNTELLRWCMAAGITKHITFHCARHTFAVSLLSQGVEIYTVSQLLGHSELKTTEIYADIIDSVRKAAMHKIPDIGL